MTNRRKFREHFTWARLRVATVRVAPALVRTDAELVAAVRSGDSRAFADLYREHVESVRRVAYDRVGDSDATADAVQDTFTRALQHLDDLREPGRFRPWLLAIARHAASDQLRARTRLTALDESHDELFASTGPGPESVAEVRELAEQVQGCIAGLSKRDAAAVTMVTQFGFTPSQVADALGVTPGAAKVIVHRARRRLRNALALQLMVKQPTLACGDFQKLLGEDPLAASKHIETCATCIERAGAAVVRSTSVPGHPTLPSLRPDQGPPRPSTLIPPSRTASARESGSAPGCQSTSEPKPSTSSS
jgi:RNA polymerase sigma-70 factor, ECF subfamily